jgi:hypothetical protein
MSVVWVMEERRSSATNVEGVSEVDVDVDVDGGFRVEQELEGRMD